jgi:hypothetical protein
MACSLGQALGTTAGMATDSMGGLVIRIDQVGDIVQVTETTPVMGIGLRSTGTQATRLRLFTVADSTAKSQLRFWKVPERKAPAFFHFRACLDLNHASEEKQTFIQFLDLLNDLRRLSHKLKFVHGRSSAKPNKA